MRIGWVPAAVAVVLVAVGWALVTAGPSATVDPDHALYAGTIAEMQAGSGYHTAMDAGLRDLYGGAVGSPLAFRLPTLFLGLSLVPSALHWPLFVLLVPIGAGLSAARLSWPPVGVLVAVWLLATARPVLAEGVHEQWLLVEFWAVPFVLLAVWRHRADDDVGGAAAALVAALLRELAAPLLVAGLVLAQRAGRPRWPWVAGLAAYGAALVLHALTASRFTTVGGSEPVLLGSGGPAAVADMAAVVGPWLLVGAWVAAAGLAVARRDWFVTPVLALPVLGLLADRPYWGVLVVPLVLVVVGELLMRRSVRNDHSAAPVRPAAGT